MCGGREVLKRKRYIIRFCPGFFFENLSIGLAARAALMIYAYFHYIYTIYSHICGLICGKFFKNMFNVFFAYKIWFLIELEELFSFPNYSLCFSSFSAILISQMKTITNTIYPKKKKEQQHKNITNHSIDQLIASFRVTGAKIFLLCFA